MQVNNNYRTFNTSCTSAHTARRTDATVHPAPNSIFNHNRPCASLDLALPSPVLPSTLPPLAFPWSRLSGLTGELLWASAPGARRRESERRASMDMIACLEKSARECRNWEFQGPQMGRGFAKAPATRLLPDWKPLHSCTRAFAAPHRCRSSHPTRCRSLCLSLRMPR
jgi:hypothetical protein